jgi:hypothetical protein
VFQPGKYQDSEHCENFFLRDHVQAGLDRNMKKSDAEARPEKHSRGVDVHCFYDEGPSHDLISSAPLPWPAITGTVTMTN